MTDTFAAHDAKSPRQPLAPRARGEGVRAQGKRGRRRDDEDRDERERRRRQEEALDEALMNTFPASDPIAVEQPARGS
jgi:hypothetical protein